VWLSLTAAAEADVVDVEAVLDEAGQHRREQDERFEGKEQQHRRATREAGGGGVVEQCGVERGEGGHEDQDARVRRERDGGRLFHVGDPVRHEPVEDLEEEQHGEERDEIAVELVAEDGHREARLGDGVPAPTGAIGETVRWRVKVQGVSAHQERS